MNGAGLLHTDDGLAVPNSGRGVYVVPRPDGTIGLAIIAPEGCADIILPRPAAAHVEHLLTDSVQREAEAE